MIKYFDKPKVMAVIADVNEGKSNLIYHLAEELMSQYNFNLVTFGLKYVIPNSKVINSLQQLEGIRDSLIFLDEFHTLIDLDDRNKKQQVERTFRLIHHNNNILLLAGVPENFKKFISGKLSVIFYKKVTIGDFINGSGVKNILTSYEGDGVGSKTLNMGKDEVLVFDGDYKTFKIPYLAHYDSKKSNKPIFVTKKCRENVGGMKNE